MKKTITLLALLAICSTTVRAQIPNGSFENWTAATGYSTPDGWDNLNAYTSPNSVYTCEQGTTGAPAGSSYLKLTSKTVGSSAVPGLAACGKYDIATKKPKSGFPFTGRPAYLTGKWQYMANGTDTGRIAVYLTRWNTTTGQREMVGGFEYDLPGMVMAWASFAIPITYSSAAMPDSAIIGLTSSNKTITAGSYLYIDSLNFSGTASGVQNLSNTQYNVKLWPNPAKDKLSVDLGIAAPSGVRLWVVDLYGRIAAEASYEAGKHIYSIGLNAVAPGVYFVKVKAGEDVQARRLVVE